MAERYAQLDAEIARAKPSRIVEVGTWNGARAQQMIAAALRAAPVVEYIGFDLFEAANDQTDAAESNVKPHHCLTNVETRLKAKYGGDQVAIKLVGGNTRQTLARCLVRPDFAFIDGGHSIETIASDYAALKHCPAIVLDDFYSEDEQGRGIDVTRFGCNMLVSELLAAGQVQVDLLPVKDPVRGGGYVQMVAVRRP